MSKQARKAVKRWKPFQVVDVLPKWEMGKYTDCSLVGPLFHGFQPRRKVHGGLAPQF